MSALRCVSLAVRPLTISLALLLLTSTASSVSAEIPPLLRPSTRAWFGQLNFGPGIGVSNSTTQFRLQIEAGYHFFGTGDGPAVGLQLSPGFGSGTTFSIGPKAWWDFQILANLGWYATPYFNLGYALWSFSSQGFFGGGTSSHFNMQFGVESKLAVNDRFFVMIRPLSFNLFIGSGTPVFYDFLFGGGVTF